MSRAANLDDFAADVAQVKVLVTYNGKCFDVPILERALRDALCPKAHVDLRYVLAGIWGPRAGSRPARSASAWTAAGT